MKNLIVLIFGIFFGVILTKSEVISWFRIQSMFHFEEAHMYLIIGSAVVTGAFSIMILKRLNLKTLNRSELDFGTKKYTHGFIIGGFLFGIGWAITGACPGPIFAQVGAGEYPAIITLLGALAGAFAYNSFKSKLPH